MIQIKRNNKVFFTLEDFGEGSKLSYQLMDHHYIILKFTTATPVYFEIGDSVEIPDFGYFELTSAYFPKHNDSDGYDYEMQMDAYYMSWKNKLCKYRPQHGANETSFKLTTTVGVHMNVILGNLKALGLTYNGKEFSVDYTTYNNKAFDVQKRFLIEYGSISILDALNSICSEDALNCEWWIDGSIIYLGYCEMEGQTTFEQDVNVLSMSYSESKSTYITRLYAFGSDRNIPKGYFTGADADVTTDGIATDYLMLPNKEVDSDGFYAKDGYLENVNVVKNDKQAIEGVVMFEDEYPKVESVVSGIKTYDSTVDNDDGTKTTQTFWQVTATDSFATSFKESWIKSNLTLGIKFTSGALMGMEFEVSFKVIDKVNYFEIVANDTYGRTLPDGVMCPKIGDKFFLYNWDATKITDTDLIPAAQLSLFDRAKQYYQKTMISNSNFTCTMDGEKFFNDGTYDYHPLGEQVKLINDMFAQVDADGKHYRNSRIIGMEIPLDIPYDHPQYTVGEKAATSRLGKLEDKVDSITVNGMQIGGTGSGNGGVYVIGLNDSTPASDSNVFSARRSRMEFLSRLQDSTAKGTITWEKVQKFLQGLDIGDNAGQWTREGVLSVFKFLTNNFVEGLYGHGAQIDEHGNMEANSIFARQFISAPKFVFNEISVTKAEQWNTNGYGTIKSVDVTNHTIDLKLEENDYGSLSEGDICRGIYADIENTYGSDTNNEGEMDECGFTMHRGFFTTYFYVKKIITAEKGKFVFEYGKRSEGTPDPCAFMDFAQYGNFTDEQRQSSMYFCSRGRSYIEVLDGVNTWEIQAENRVTRYGWLGGLRVKKTDGTWENLKGNGLFAQNNVYLGGAVITLSQIKDLDSLKLDVAAYDVTMSQPAAVITVDDLGNVINGLWSVDEAGVKQYRISTAIFAHKGESLLLLEDEKNMECTAGHYRVYAIGNGCDVKVENGAVFLIGINKIKDGVAGSADDSDFDYDAMRKISACSITIVVELEGKVTKNLEFPVRIHHDSLPFMVCDLSNENASIAWNTKTAKYIGLPITTKVSLMYQNTPWEISELNVGAVNGLKTSISLQGKEKVITIDADNITSDILEQITKIPITVVGVYAGVSYEYTKELTILRSADMIVYDVVPSVDSVVVDKDGNLNTKSVSCKVYATSSDDKRYALSALPSGYQLKYGYGDTADTALALGGSVTASIDHTRITFALYDNKGALLDQEMVPIVSFGKDGKGIEYIFKRTTDSTPPSNPTPSDWSTNAEYLRTDKEYVPSGWTDDPIGVDAVNLYEWVSKRVSTNGHWGAFSEPAEYAHFGKHAAKATLSDYIVTIPTDSAGNALSAFSEAISCTLVVDGKLCSSLSVSADSLPSGVTISGTTINVSYAKSYALGKNSKVVKVKISGKLDDASYSDTITLTILPNVSGVDGDGYEYVFYLSNSSTPPSKPSRYNGKLSGDWVDDPPSPTDDNRYVYVSYYEGKVGAPNVSQGLWSSPALWAYKAPKGDPGKQGVGNVTSITISDWTESTWNNAGTYGTAWSFGSDTSSKRNGCRVDDLFTVVGTATDTKNSHTITYKSLTDSGVLKGTCLSHTVAYRGEQGGPGGSGPTGPRGTKGPIQRTHDGFETGSYDYSDGTKDTDKFIDIVVVDGQVYYCIKSYRSSSPSINDTEHWAQGSNFDLVATKLLLAANATITMANSQQINIMDGDTLWGSFRYAATSDDYALWLGASDGASAPFAVTRGGAIRATAGQIGSFSIESFTDATGFTFYGLKAKHAAYGIIPWVVTEMNYRGIHVESGSNNDDVTNDHIATDITCSSGGAISISGNTLAVADDVTAIYTDLVPKTGYRSYALKAPVGDVLLGAGAFIGALRPSITITYSYSRTLSENECYIICNNTSAITLTLPANPREGQLYLVYQAGARVNFSTSSSHPIIAKGYGSTGQTTWYSGTQNQLSFLTYGNDGRWYVAFTNG